MLNQFAYPFLGICLSILLSSCSSKRIYIKDLNRPLNTLHLAIKYALSGNVKKISPNSRIYYSPYHSPGMDLNALPLEEEHRARVIMSIHGIRRPYRISVIYKVEEYRRGRYRLHHYNRKITQKYIEKLEEYLVSRPEQRDIIDDFTPY